MDTEAENELISSGLAGMETISVGESSTKTEMKTIRRAEAASLTRFKEMLERSMKRREEWLLRNPQPPPSRYEWVDEEQVVHVEPTEEEEMEGYRAFWERCFGRYYGSFEDESKASFSWSHVLYDRKSGTIPPDALTESALQIFSIKVTDPRYGLRWPLQVHGFVAARDSVDRKRIYLFRRTRDNCQTLTRQDPFLRLTGPSRAVLLIDPIAIEVQLKVKGKITESEDEVLAFKCFNFHENYPLKDGICACIGCKRCRLEFALAVLPMSVEATVGVRVVEGSWPDQYRGLIVCSTEIGKEAKVVLLDFQDGKLPTDPDDGTVELSRRVVSLDYSAGKVIVLVEASRDNYFARCTPDFGGASFWRK